MTNNLDKITRKCAGPRPAGARACYLSGDVLIDTPQGKRWIRDYVWVMPDGALMSDGKQYGYLPARKAKDLGLPSYRGAVGAHNGGSKLSDADAANAIKRHKRGETHVAIARSLGVNEATVRRIVHGDSWRHIPRQRKPS